MEYAVVHGDLGLPKNGSVDYSMNGIPYLESWMYECTFGLLSTYVQHIELKPQNPDDKLVLDWSNVGFAFISDSKC